MKNHWIFPTWDEVDGAKTRKYSFFPRCNSREFTKKQSARRFNPPILITFRYRSARQQQQGCVCCVSACLIDRSQVTHTLSVKHFLSLIFMKIERNINLLLAAESEVLRILCLFFFVSGACYGMFFSTPLSVTRKPRNPKPIEPRSQNKKHFLCHDKTKYSQPLPV